MAEMATGPGGSESLLFLTDEQVRKGIEAMFFAYRGFTADPDRILEGLDLAAPIIVPCISSIAAPEPRSTTCCRFWGSQSNR